MRILIVGDGKVGHTLATELLREGHDITIIDQNDEVIRKTEDTLDVLCIHGNCANVATLMEAEADRADILIAATASDEVNMLCSLISKKLGTKFTIARIRDPEYNESVALLQHELGIDMTLNPERATAQEISRLLRYPFASNIEPFAKGRVELVEFLAREEDIICGKPLKELTSRHSDLPKVLYCAVERDGEVVIPGGDFVIEPGDRVHVAAEMVTVTHFFRHIGRSAKPVKDVMLLGGGRISYYLAKMVEKMGIRVVMFEINPEKAKTLSEQLPHADIIEGDGTDQDLLEQENLAGMDAFIALSDRDEENLMTGLYAQTHGVPKVIVKTNRYAYKDVIANLGLETQVSPRIITCNTLLRYVRARVNAQGTAVEKLYRLVDGKAEALEFIARKGDPYIGVPLKELTVRKGTLVAIILHKNKVIVPFGDDVIEAGDNVVIISTASGISDLNEVIRK
ncbi:MAG: Trk system potassium transporter TrkA [Clostridia bacterium]|nr:Trk system potassium transporter TrkA [Clostridia bacterium]MBQ3155918.1 Trk system potassium transporter TrkA [Clostridia bacterium]MBQ7138213.1 Trk system potassium transporter TrkA [Clostridia bacterium]